VFRESPHLGDPMVAQGVSSFGTRGEACQSRAKAVQSKGAAVRRSDYSSSSAGSTTMSMPRANTSNWVRNYNAVAPKRSPQDTSISGTGSVLEAKRLSAGGVQQVGWRRSGPPWRPARRRLGGGARVR
jgi:hypothetical protein